MKAGRVISAAQICIQCSLFLRLTQGCDFRLDNKHVVFGRVLGDSMLVVRKLENVATGAANKPKLPVMVTECGEL